MELEFDESDTILVRGFEVQDETDLARVVSRAMEGRSLDF